MPATAQPSAFQARVTLALCPEYQWGGVGVAIKYTIPGVPDVFTATINSQSIDSAANTGVFDISLPNYLGTTPINVFAECTSSLGTSAPSNNVAISNCDALALKDSDADGMNNRDEDRNCDNFFSPGDYSNPDNVDTDGDGVRDLVELFSATDPTNPASSPRPFVLKGGPFDPDGDGNANPVVWRPAGGMWFVRDFGFAGNTLALQFGLPGDVPFVYDYAGGTSNVGVVRLNPANNLYTWYFNGPGFERSTGERENIVSFGFFGDNLIPGPWETPGVTNPAVARLFNGVWTFMIYKADGTVRILEWGGNGDLLKIDDYDGDGIYDFAVFRPSDSMVHVLGSVTGVAQSFAFGSGAAEHLVRGDFTADGQPDICFWYPQGGIFDYLDSQSGYSAGSERTLQLGLYNVHLPLSYNRQGGYDLFTVIDHAAGLRYWRVDNNEANEPQSLQWGLPGDAQG